VLEGDEKMMMAMYKSMPDLHLTIEDMIAQVIHGQLMSPICISVSAFARFLRRSLITEKESMNYQRLSLLSETSWSAAGCQNALGQYPSSSSLHSGLGFCPGPGRVPDVDKNYHFLSQGETIEGISSISMTQAKNSRPFYRSNWSTTPRHLH